MAGRGGVPGWHLREGIIVGFCAGVGGVELSEFRWIGTLRVVDRGRGGPLIARGEMAVLSVVGGVFVGIFGAALGLVSGGRAAAATARTAALATGVAAAGAGDYSPDSSHQNDAADGDADDDGPSASIDRSLVLGI